MNTNTIALLSCCFLALSCSTSQTADNNVRWYRNQSIEQLLPESETVYVVQIGIMAQAFRLERENTQSRRHLALLHQSLLHRTTVDVGVEKNSNRIVAVNPSPP